MAGMRNSSQSEGKKSGLKAKKRPGFDTRSLKFAHHRGRVHLSYGPKWRSIRKALKGGNRPSQLHQQHGKEISICNWGQQ